MSVPRDVLLDDRHPFLPPTLALFTKLAFFQPMARFYWEFEVIWQAVLLQSWIEVQNYLYTMAWDVKRREASLSQQRTSYNFLSAEVREMWRESQDVRKKRIEYDPYACGTGVFIHMLRRKFIIDFNSKHPKLDPPLQWGDNLCARLAPFGGLATLAEDRLQSQESTVADPSQRVGALTNEEKRHLRAFGELKRDEGDDELCSCELDRRSEYVTCARLNIITIGLSSVFVVVIVIRAVAEGSSVARVCAPVGTRSMRCIAKTSVAPLDRVKILFQTRAPDYARYAG
ncbi:BZ3500_MvSof-1268-A1-R1_Chr3-1g05701 [Microbotryum saponariae]|uniref:BZ3500_MvSof-1268-A1-R1_Chr3-1g05701 protein n=1 Tax=Microbotryum saponariae TaxID=289078 RepID=A0A2X0L254_9BASI|nr:BZ3500_MvSof-1268-A1-R1_Chr3-1g05701 [Microbotryum saponariae]SDA04891.1 BZ3501_MvSof-1269-A2-R1_Chr3-1g05371 [Microbotryum saponariae]